MTTILAERPVQALMAKLASKENDWSYLQTIYWKDLDRLTGWCWMNIPDYA